MRHICGLTTNIIGMRTIHKYCRAAGISDIPGYCRMNPVELPKYCQVSDGSDS